MKKIIIVIAAIVLSIVNANAQLNIVSELAKHKDIVRITELCSQYDSMQAQAKYEEDPDIKAIFSSYALKSLEQIGSIYTGVEMGADNMNMNLFNIGYDIYTIYNSVVKKVAEGNKNLISESDYITVKACEQDINKNKEEIFKI